MNKHCGKLQTIETAGLTILLLYCLLSAGCGREETAGTLPGQTEKAAEGKKASEETSQADSASKETGQTDAVSAEMAQENAPEYKPDSFRFNPELALNSQSNVSESRAQEQGRTILTLQASVANPCLTASIAGFNRQSDSYYVKLLESGFGESLNSCRDRLLIELAAGKGPDLFVGDVLPTITESLLEKEILMDLGPWLDTLGITDENYFPAVRALKENGHVFGVNPYIDARGYWMLESVLGGRELPDIETLVEKLYSYPDQDAVWRQYMPYYLILDYLLGGSENMWGMIDWEEGRCDFSGDLFAKILEITKRYADPDGIGQTAISGFFTLYSTERKQLESEGKVILDYPFDDGWYPYCGSFEMLMINANTKCPEGALEFLQYILGEEGQTYMAYGMQSCLPANRSTADSYKAWELQLQEEGTVRNTKLVDDVWVEYSITQEMADEMKDYSDRARYLPLKTEEIQSIIYEEAWSFFTGDKPLEPVIDLIQNRVQLYLDEHR